jgi:GTPase SAR1 family protein
MSPYQVTFIGSAGCGKSSLIRCLQEEPFEPRWLPTTTRVVVVDKRGEPSLVDTAGAQVFGTFTPAEKVILGRTDLWCFVHDSLTRDTMAIEQWYEKLQHDGFDMTRCVLVLTKADCYDCIQMTPQLIQTLKFNLGARTHIWVSAKQGEVNDLKEAINYQ